VIEPTVVAIIDSNVTDSLQKNMAAVCRLVCPQSNVKLWPTSQTNNPNNILALWFIGRSTYLKVGGIFGYVGVFL
jgi:hypothetical protein